MEGLIHISEISENRIEHPKEVLKEGDVKSLRVIRIDPEQHRIGLSLRKVDSAAFADKDFKMMTADFDTFDEPTEPLAPPDETLEEAPEVDEAPVEEPEAPTEENPPVEASVENTEDQPSAEESSSEEEPEETPEKEDE